MPILTRWGGVLVVLLPMVATAQIDALQRGAGKLQWRVSPRIAVEETFSDNVFLEPSGRENWDLVTHIQPGVDVSGRGNRVQANFSYTMDAVYYARYPEEDEVYHRFRGEGNVEVLEEHFFIEGQARRTQEALTLTGPISLDTTNATDNRVNATVIEVSPYLVNRYGDFANSELRYTHRRAWYDSGNNDEGYTNRYSASLDSGELFNRSFWGLDASHEVVEQDDERDAGKFNTVSGTLGYRLTRHLSVSGTYGYENNEYETFRDTIDGAFWNVGFRWVPTRRTSVEARYGERFFGNTGNLAISHRRRTTLWQVSYTESVQSTRDLVLQQVGVIPIFDPSVCLPSDPGCEPVTEIQLVSPQLVDDFFIAELWRASVTAFGPRQSLTLAYTDLHRTFERDGAEETQRGLSLSYRLDLDPRNRLDASAGWARNDIVREDRTDTLWHVRAALVRELSPEATVSLAVRHQERDSDENASEYAENAITARFSYRF